MFRGCSQHPLPEKTILLVLFQNWSIPTFPFLRLMGKEEPEHFSRGWAVISRKTESSKTHTQGQGKRWDLQPPEEFLSGALRVQLGGGGWMCPPL